jgi:hypothetical protein
LFDRGAAQLIQSCESPFVGFPFVIKNQPQQRRAKLAVATWFCDRKNGSQNLAWYKLVDIQYHYTYFTYIPIPNFCCPCAQYIRTVLQ